MRCQKIADWLEIHGEEQIGSEWENLLVHARSCPDCSLYLKQRGTIFEAMKQMSDPPLPIGLKEMILENIAQVEEFSDSSSSPSRDWIDYFLPPLQLVATGICLVVILGLLFPYQKLGTQKGSPEMKISFVTLAAKQEEKPVPKQGESLVRLSPQEVNDFMRKLEEYRRLHPEMDTPPRRSVPSELAVFQHR